MSSLTSSNNCSTEVIQAFDGAGLDIEAGDYNALNRLGGGKFMGIMNAVLDCSVCAESGGRGCADGTASDVVQVAIMRNVFPGAAYSDYFRRRPAEQPLAAQSSLAEQK